ncbi:MAG: cell division protein FtsW [Ruminococcaceae bacterium]|nr:cell division protein FtsW [Oscillospiraceae bacterium]
MQKKENSLKVLFLGRREEKGFKQYKATGGLDIMFLILVMYLVVIGTIMMFSAGYVKAETETGDPLDFLKKQIVFLAIGIPAMLIVSKIKPEIYKKYSLTIYTIALILLFVVLFYHTDVQSAEGDDYTRWIPLGPITIQPSDVAKFALIVFMAALMDNNRKKVETKWSYVILLMIPVVIVAGLVLLEKHFSATFLLVAIGLLMIYLGGGKQWVFIVAVVIGIIGIIFIITNMDFLPEYVQSRLRGWLDKDYDPLGKRWQTNQSLYAIGSGGLFGLGLGNSKQKHLYLPEPHNDFIFSVVCEELGFIRTVLFVIIPFSLLVLRGFQIAMKLKNRYAALVVMGIMVQIGLQTFFNIGVVTGMLPNTGISLPFFSYGGTALVIQLCEMGVVLAASRALSNKSNVKD